MANLTVTVAVTTGTQYVTGSTGNIYTFDGSQPASFTFPWVEDGTVRLDQSGSSNDNHPLIFSTSNSTNTATMRAGIISSGVTYYLDGSSSESDYTNTTTFNAATTRYIEITPSAETDFYFACWVHGIGMGGIVDITETAWGAMSWGRGTWNDQEKVSTGWGRLGWGDQAWGDTPIVNLTGLSITASLGDLDYAGSVEGWGRDTWGSNQWGEDAVDVSLTGLEMSGLMGPSAWGEAPWNEQIGWGGDLALTTTQLSIVTPTGLSMTGSVGALTISRLDMVFALTTSLQMSAGLGTPSINNGADHSQGLASLLATGSVGSLGHEMTYALTGLEATGSVGTLTTNDAKLVNISTSLLATGSLGSLTIADMAVGLTGLQATGAVGSTTVTDMQIGLLGLEISGALGSGGVSPLHYKDVDITGNTSYTGISITGNTTYTDITHAGSG